MSVEPQIVVICHDEGGSGSLYGPFSDEAAAVRWIKQHNNDIPARYWSEEVKGSPLTDEDDQAFDDHARDHNHYCLNLQTLAGDFNEHHQVLELKPIMEVIIDGT